MGRTASCQSRMSTTICDSRKEISEATVIVYCMVWLSSCLLQCTCASRAELLIDTIGGRLHTIHSHTLVNNGAHYRAFVCWTACK